MKTLLGIVLAHAAGIAILVLLGIWISPAIDHYGKRYSGIVSVLSTSFGIYSFILNLSYHKNLSFHLFVDRLLLSVSRSHTYWLPAFDFELPPDAARDRQAILILAADAVEQAYGGRVRRTIVTPNTAALSLDDLMCLTLRVGDGCLNVTLDRKILVPAHLYDDYRRRFAEIAESVSRATKPTSIRCGISVTFPEGTKNPYYGFFVNRIPADLINHFEVSFKTSSRASCRVEAGTDHVSIEGRSLIELFDTLSKVLSLRALPDGAAS